MSTGKEILKKRKESFKRWGLESNPFFNRPPEPKLLKKIFTGRKKELAIAISTVHEKSRNLLAYGLFGIGKTVFVLETLRELKEADNVLVIYTSLIGDTPSDFAKTILLALTKSLSEEEDKEAAELLDSIVGVERIESTADQTYDGVKIGLPGGIFGVKGGLQSAITSSEQIKIAEPRYYIDKLIKKANQKYNRVVIAIDDLEKKDPSAVRRILIEARDILFYDCSFILTGHPLGVTRDIYTSTLRVFERQIHLKSLSEPELNQIVINYLNTARHEEKQDPYPFTEEALSIIKKKSNGSPGLLNLICYRVLDAAAMRGFEEIDKASLVQCLEEIKEDMYYEISLEMRYLLEVVRETGEFSEDTSLGNLRRLGVTTFTDAIPKLEKLVQADLLIKLEDKGGIRYIISPLLEKPL